MEKPFPAYTGDESFIFVCYAHQNSDTVYEELNRLHNDGINFWYDEGIGGGTVWRAELAHSIEKADIVLFFVTPESVQSAHCNRELNYALDCNRPILPVYLEETELPADLRIGLSRIQAIHRVKLSPLDYCDKLLSALQSDYEWPAAISPQARRHLPIWVLAIALLTVLAMAGGFIYEREPTVVSDRIDSIAVLPFDNLSGDQEQAYFAAGLQDAMIGSLSKIKSLRVISRKSTLRYQDSDLSFSEIARELNVTAMIEASILRLQDQVRIEVQLVRAFPQEDHLWSATYERDLSDVLSMLNEVAKTVASEIEISLSEGEVESLATARTMNPRTYEAYLRGTYKLNQSTNESVKEGLKILHEAVANDPADPFAYAALALGYVNAGHGSIFIADVHDPWQRARAAAVQALKLDPNLADAHTALAEVKGYYEWDWSGAEQSFKRALVLNPNLAEAHYQYGWQLTIRNRNVEAEKHMLLAKELDPLHVDYTAWLGGWYWMMGRPEEAIEEVSKAFELDPNSITSNWVLAQVSAGQGDLDRSLDALQNLGRILNRGDVKSAGTGLIYALMGRRAEAQEVLEQIDLSSAAPMMLAQIYALLGDKDGAFRQLEIVFDIPVYSAGMITVSPAFRSLREDPRYFALLSRANLSP